MAIPARRRHWFSKLALGCIVGRDVTFNFGQNLGDLDGQSGDSAWRCSIPSNSQAATLLPRVA